MSNEPSLPHIPPSKAADAIFGSSRKRMHPSDAASAFPASLLANSSDPAVFSSDDDPALDNYAPSGRKRKKKRYVGAWFAQHPTSADSVFSEGDAANTDGHPDPGSASGPTLPARSEPGRQLTSSGAPETSRHGQHRNHRHRKHHRHHKHHKQDNENNDHNQDKRLLERQFDSGVWMDSAAAAAAAAATSGRSRAPSPTASLASNSSASSECSSPSSASGSSVASQLSTSSHLSLAPLPPLPTRNPHAELPIPPHRYRRIFQRVPSLAANSAEEAARKVIQTCIEKGTEQIDLMALDLTSLSNATIDPLSGLVPIPLVTQDVAFEQRDPELSLFLSNNRLVSLPGALFSLDHLAHLTLRNNGLTELPPAIGQLTGLRTLNVSLNALRVLPAELLRLLPASGCGGQLTELLLYPNPFLEPRQLLPPSDHAQNQTRIDDAGGNEADLSNKNKNVDQPRPILRSPVHYLDSCGKTWSIFSLAEKLRGAEPDQVDAVDWSAATSPPPWSTLSCHRRPRQQQHDQAQHQTGHQVRASRVPTLMELAMRACYKSSQLGHLPDMMPHETPVYIREQLRRALILREAGGHACSVCGSKPLVAPMAQWIEWWEIPKHDLNKPAMLGQAAGHRPDCVTIPFIRRGCSWGCVPQVE